MGSLALAVYRSRPILDVHGHAWSIVYIGNSRTADMCCFGSAVFYGIEERQRHVIRHQHLTLDLAKPS